MTQEEIIEMAREADLDWHTGWTLDDEVPNRFETFANLVAAKEREALAQPDPYKQGYTDAMNWKVQNHLEHLPTAKPEQEPVQWGVDWGKAGDIPCVSIIKRLPDGGIKVLAVEYAPYSYTTSPKQEPVAWRWENGGKDKWLNKYIYLDNGAPDYPEECEPLYTIPPQRKPLTDEQIMANDVLRYHFALNGGAGPISKQGRKVIDAIEAAHGIKE